MLSISETVPFKEKRMLFLVKMWEGETCMRTDLRTALYKYGEGHFYSNSEIGILCLKKNFYVDV